MAHSNGGVFRAAIYVRVSTRHQAEDGLSLDDQRATLSAHADRMGWQHEVFSDAGISGETLDQRPGMTRLLEEVEAGRFQIVLVVDDSRLARDELVGALIRDRLKKAGVRLATPHGERNLSDPNDNFVANVLAAASAFEQDLRTDKMRRGLRNTAEQGYWTGGPAPFGYKLVKDGVHTRLQIDDDTAEVIRIAVSLVIDHGCSTHEAAKRLNALGLRPANGGVFNHRKVRRLLESDTLAGRWTYGRSRGRTSVHGEPITIDIPRLIPQERHELLKAVLDQTGRDRPGTRHVYTLSAHLFGQCGKAYYWQYRRDRMTREYICNGKSADIVNVADRCDDRRYPADDVEFIVWEAIRQLLGEPERLLLLARDFLGLRGEQVQLEGDQLEVIDRRIRDLTAALTERATQALKAGLPADVLASATAELTAERDALVRHRDQLRAWQQHNAAESARMRQLWDLAELAHRRLAAMTQQEQKYIVGLLGLRVTIVQHATRRTPAKLAIEGAVHERLLQPDGLDHDLTQLAALRRRGEAPRPTGMPFRMTAAVE